MPNLKRMRDRTFEFGCAVINEFRRLEPFDEAESVLWSELLKTQKSLATNSAESDGTQSRKDFIQKFQMRECDEIIAILVTSLKTAKRNDAAQQTHRKRRL